MTEQFTEIRAFGDVMMTHGIGLLVALLTVVLGLIGAKYLARTY
jgi:hypothetical protein